MTFDHLSGPFADCHEVIEVREAAGGCQLVHTGAFTMRAGVLGWFLGLLLVRPAFERHVRDHLLDIRSQRRPAPTQA